MVGAAAHISSENYISADEEIARLTNTIKEFEDPEVEMQDPRKEAADVLRTIRGIFTELNLPFHKLFPFKIK